MTTALPPGHRLLFKRYKTLRLAATFFIAVGTLSPLFSSCFLTFLFGPVPSPGRFNSYNPFYSKYPSIDIFL